MLQVLDPMYTNSIPSDTYTHILDSVKIMFVYYGNTNSVYCHWDLYGGKLHSQNL